MVSTLIAATALPRTLDAKSAASGAKQVILDCRFQLSDSGAGRRAYEAGHVPGAHYADLERDLSGPVVRGVTGRHPLPDPEALGEALRGWGVCSDSRVIAYDDAAGAMAARLWWLMRWLGHDDVFVCDGGYQAWLASGGQPTPLVPEAELGDFEAHLHNELVVTSEQVLQRSSEALLLDARAGERYRGEVEPIDAIPGHIPGAICVPFAQNLAGSVFADQEHLRQRYRAIVKNTPAEDVIVYCGSGVTACHDILAAEHGGLGLFRLYAGSYSEWIVDPSRPVSVGDSE